MMGRSRTRFLFPMLQNRFCHSEYHEESNRFRHDRRNEQTTVTFIGIAKLDETYHEDKKHSFLDFLPSFFVDRELHLSG